MITLEVENNGDNNWNKRLIDSKLGTTAQIKELTYQLTKNHEIPIFLKFIDSKGNIVGQLLLSEIARFNSNNKKNFFLNKLGQSSNILRFANIKTKLYRWSYGPVIFNNEYNFEIYDKLKKFLLNDNNHKILGWQHPFSTKGISEFKNHFSLVKWSTFAIDLTRSKEELYQNIEKHSGQKNIQRAEKRGITIEKITENNLYEYFTLLNKSKMHRNELNLDYDYFLNLWKLFKPFGRSGFLARKDSKAISGLSFSSLCGHIIEGGVARSITDKTNVLYSQDLIKWKIIEWGLKNKMKWYNLAGYNPNPITPKEEGIMRFKKKWGGIKFDYYGIKSK